MRDLTESAASLLPELIELRRRLHRRPEVGLTLPETQSALEGALAGLPLALRKGASLSSLVARLDGALPGPTILLRADMDALPVSEANPVAWRSELEGRAHACGHDAHMAMLIGAARLLCARRERIAGRVLFVFQPGEEAWGGARIMLEEGLLDPQFAGEVTQAFAIHQFPTLPAGSIATRAGPLMAAMDGFRITVRGRGGHASTPHETIDPVPIACEIVIALQTWVARRVPAFDPAVVTVSKIHAGTAPAVIPDYAVLEGLVRSVSEATRALVMEGIATVANGIAQAHGASAEIAIGTGDLAGTPVTVNDATVAARVLTIASELFGPARVIDLATPIMASEDFAFMLRRVPGAMVFLGTQPTGVARGEPLHSPRMMLDEAQLATGAALHAAFALTALGASGPTT
jgi:hippurate hydrolase